MADFDIDAYLGTPKAARSKPAAKGGDDFDIDAYLGTKPLPGAIELPPEASMPTGHLDLKGGKGFVPDKRTRAVFTDITPSGEPGYTAEELREAKPDTSAQSKTAFLGGALQGATFGLGDEAAALLSDKPYAEARDENRRAFRDAQAMDPKSYAMGHIAGSAAMIPATPSLAPAAGKSLLSAGNLAKAAAAGGLTGLGESEADLTTGDLYGAAKDTATGARNAAGLALGLGLIAKGGRGIGEWAIGAPERVAKRADDALIDAATLGAPAGMRDKLQGELGSDRSNILEMIKSNPELRKAVEEKRYADATNIVRTMQNDLKKTDASVMAELDSGARTIDEYPRGYRDPKLFRTQEIPAVSMEELVSGGKPSGAITAPKRPPGANPSVAPRSEVAEPVENIRGYRDPKLFRTQEIPAVSMEELVSGGKPSGAEAPPKLTKSLIIDARPLVANLEARQKALASNPAVEAQAEAAAMQKRIDFIKERWIPEPPPKTPSGGELLKSLVGNAQKYDVDRAAHSADDFLATAKRYQLPKTANDPVARLGAIDASVEKLNKANDKIYEKSVESNPIYVANFTGTLREHADALRMQYGSGSLPDAIDGFAARIAKTAQARGETTISPRELRSLISEQQGKAFSGSFSNPADAKEAWQEVTRVMRGHLEEHVKKYAGKNAFEKLKRNNKAISILLPFRSSAEEEIAASRLMPSPEPETRTGFATPSEIRSMIGAIKDPNVKRELTGEFYRQIGTENAHQLAALDDQATRMSRLEEPLSYLAERNSTPPTTLRHHVGSIHDYLTHGGISGGLTLAASGHAREGLAVIGATLATKYGVEPFKAAERGIAAMVTAHRMGASDAHLMALAKMARVPYEMAKETIVLLASREAATKRGAE